MKGFSPFPPSLGNRKNDSRIPTASTTTIFSDEPKNKGTFLFGLDKKARKPLRGQLHLGYSIRTGTAKMEISVWSDTG